MDRPEMQMMRFPNQDRLLRDGLLWKAAEIKADFQKYQSFTQNAGQETTYDTFHKEGLSIEEMLLRKTKDICEKYKIHFVQLTLVQRKFVTHYRCSQCGLLPLYCLDLLHVKRVRCRECGQLIAFRKKGKYGKLRKEIAIELMKEIQDVIIPT